MPDYANQNATPSTPIPRRLDLDLLTRELFDDPTWDHSEENSRMIVDQPRLHVMLVALASDGAVAGHPAPATATFQVLHGRIILGLAEGPLELGVGGLAVVTAGEQLDACGLEDSAFLITATWPD